MAILDTPHTDAIDAPHTLEQALARDPREAPDEVTILVRISRTNLERLQDGIPCQRLALKPYDHPAPDPIGVFVIAAEGGPDFRDSLPVRR